MDNMATPYAGANDLNKMEDCVSYFNGYLRVVKVVGTPDRALRDPYW